MASLEVAAKGVFFFFFFVFFLNYHNLLPHHTSLRSKVR
jgi:hypothetical protein